VSLDRIKAYHFSTKDRVQVENQVAVDFDEDDELVIES
jgi:hypothetical protein